MDLYTAERLARTLMEQHGLVRDGWTFRWSSGKRQLGLAQIRRQRCPRTGQLEQCKTIRLSRYLVQLNSDAEVRDTILHEIAHALAGLEHGHNARWKAVCRQIGAVPKRLADASVVTPDARYRVICTACQRVLAHRHRRVDRQWLKRAYCSACGPTTTGRLRVHDLRTPGPSILLPRVQERHPKKQHEAAMKQAADQL